MPEPPVLEASIPTLRHLYAKPAKNRRTQSPANDIVNPAPNANNPPTLAATMKTAFLPAVSERGPPITGPKPNANTLEQEVSAACYNRDYLPRGSGDDLLRRQRQKGHGARNTKLVNELLTCRADNGRSN